MSNNASEHRTMPSHQTRYNTRTTQHFASRLEYLEKVLELHQTSTPRQRTRFLELGCVPTTRKLLSSNPTADITANDLSTAQIKLARENLTGSVEENDGNAERLTLIEDDMMKLSFPDWSFDAAFGFYSSIHLLREEQTEMVKRIAGWLRPGGYLLANFAEGETEAIVTEKWFAEKNWMFWSGLGQENDADNNGGSRATGCG